MRRDRCWLIPGSLTLGLLLLAGCHSPSKRAPQTDDVTAIVSEGVLEKRSRAHAHYAAGVSHDLNERSDLALEEFFKAAESDPADETLILEVARRLSLNKKPEKALELLLPASALPDASGAVFARLGLVYTQLGQSDKAIEANRTAVKKLPQTFAGYQNLYLNYLQAKQPEKALTLLDEAAKIPGVNADFLVSIGELYVNYTLQFPTQRETVRFKALAALTQAEKLPLGSSHLRFRLAECYNSLGDTDSAAKAYLAMLKNPTDLPLLRDTARTRLAEIYLRTDDRKGAIQQLEAVVRDDPANAMAYYFLGRLSFEEKQMKEAVEYLRKALLFGTQFDPQRYEQAHYDLALAQISLDDAAGALATLESARKKFSANYALEYFSGVAESSRKEFAKALKHFTEAEVIARATEPKLLDHRFYFQVGAASERVGNRAMAQTYFEKCLAMSPDFSPALNYLGYMWAERGEHLDRARELIERALKVEPDSAAYLDSLGWVLFKQQQPKEALNYILKAVKLNEEPDATLYDHLGDIYAALNQMDKAREAWTKSLGIEKNEAIQKKLDAPPSK